MGVKASYPAHFIEDVWKKPLPPKECVFFDVFMHTKKGWFKLSFSEGHFLITGCEDPSGNNPTGQFIWRPESTMRDFDVIDAFTSEEYRISKGQGIGVIIIESHRAYVKLVHDEKAPEGIKVIFTTWHHGDDAKQVLDGDVSIGYDVQYRSGSSANAKWWCLHEKRAPVGIEGKTLIPGFERYQKYEPSESESAAATAKPAANKRSRSKSPKRETPKDRSRSVSPASKSKKDDEN